MTTKEIIKNTDKKILLTIGFRWRHPTTYLKEVSKEEALNTIDWCARADIEEFEDHVELDCYSTIDME